MTSQTGRLPSAVKIEWWSPSTYNTLLRCPLALAYDRDTAMRARFRRTSTFSALGEISHRLTELVWKGEYNAVPDEGLRAALAQRWDDLAAEWSGRLAEAWQPAVPPPLAEWPYYEKSRARMLARLRRDAESFRMKPLSPAKPAVLVEEWLSDPTIGLRGKPDRVQWRDGTYRVVDLKAGPHVEGISPAHLQQLLLYAHLVAVNTGFIPEQVAVVNSLGVEFTAAVSASDIEACIGAFTSGSQQFNDDVSNPASLVAQASPSGASCRRCPYRGVCPAFDEGAESNWDGRVVKGDVTSVGSELSFVLRIRVPKDLADSSAAVRLSVPENVSVGEEVVCLDVYPESSPIRLGWDSMLLRL